MSASQIDITAYLTDMGNGLDEAAALLHAIEAITELEDCPETLAVMSRMGGKLIHQALSQRTQIAEWCRAIDMERIEREAMLAEIADSDEGQALRDLSRDMAQRINQICEPAMRAITNMQNHAGQIDDMIQRARDMAGCLRPIHHPDRDPNKPEVGSLRASIEASRPGSLSAEMERRSREGPRWMREGRSRPGALEAE